jgi:hypothetical protein
MESAKKMKIITLWKILNNEEKEIVEITTNVSENFAKILVEELKKIYDLNLVDKENQLYYGLGELYQLEVKERNHVKTN